MGIKDQSPIFSAILLSSRNLSPLFLLPLRSLHFFRRDSHRQGLLASTHLPSSSSSSSLPLPARQNNDTLSSELKQKLARTTTQRRQRLWQRRAGQPAAASRRDSSSSTPEAAAQREKTTKKQLGRALLLSYFWPAGSANERRRFYSDLNISVAFKMNLNRSVWVELEVQVEELP
ncbi:uncharacterized protein LOC107020939 [Solanum pennellii]|uniref:Uncharacterized protein LOC107020939 n=1 Tax=Solanum pennellii TaxID=28526 RepID=A0ABM1GWH5_SOLPN|nr:uncharacterized protein LOC107020939 [Solanum pennellii]